MLQTAALVRVATKENGEKMKKSIVSLLLASALLSACAGTAFKWDDVQKVEVGMTQQEVTSLLGKPNLVMAQGDSTICAWSYATALGSARSVSITFDKDGKVKAKPPMMIDTH